MIRPHFHFTPPRGWMNDPNGLVFHDGIFHLFYQHHPNSTVWGPMHWGHATSRDLISWQHHAIALFPNELGAIFSGCALSDTSNTSGFMRDGIAPLIAIYTQNDSVRWADVNAKGAQVQSLALSYDGGQSWSPYENNPVLCAPALRDFRDPKVFWFSPRQCWIQCLAAGDEIQFFSSSDLKTWTFESAFGKGFGSHDGVWECPDLFSLTARDGTTKWILLVSINPGGLNGGSATQYFIGQFDGKRFTSDDETIRWLDMGSDCYAGVTWSGLADRVLFIAWMSNWDYAQALPVSEWNGAMTMPRELTLNQVEGGWRVASQPARELRARLSAAQWSHASTPSQPIDCSAAIAAMSTRGFMLRLDFAALASFTLTFANETDGALSIGFDAATNEWFIDRTACAYAKLPANFKTRATWTRARTTMPSVVEIWVDTNGVEAFFDEGVSPMTSQVMTKALWTQANLQHATPARFRATLHAIAT